MSACETSIWSRYFWVADRVGGRTCVEKLRCVDTDGNETEYGWEMGGMWIGRYVCHIMFRVLENILYTSVAVSLQNLYLRVNFVTLLVNQLGNSILFCHMNSRLINPGRATLFSLQKTFFTWQCNIVVTEVESISFIIAEIKLILWIWYKNSMKRHMINI